MLAFLPLLSSMIHEMTSLWIVNILSLLINIAPKLCNSRSVLCLHKTHLWLSTYVIVIFDLESVLSSVFSSRREIFHSLMTQSDSYSVLNSFPQIQFMNFFTLYFSTFNYDWIQLFWIGSLNNVTNNFWNINMIDTKLNFTVIIQVKSLDHLERRHSYL